MKLVLDLMEAWVEKGVTAREVAFIKRYLVRSHAFDIDTPQKRLHQALDVELLGLPADYFTGWLDRVRAVDADAASQAVARRIHPEDLQCVTVATAANILEAMRAAIPRLAETNVVPFDAE
jgi:zinc protease